MQSESAIIFLFHGLALWVSLWDSLPGLTEQVLVLLVILVHQELVEELGL